MAQFAQRVQSDRVGQLHQIAAATLEVAHVPVEQQVLRRIVRVQAGTQLIELHRVQTSGKPIRRGPMESSGPQHSTPICSPVTTSPNSVNGLASWTSTITVWPARRSLPSKTTI